MVLAPLILSLVISFVLLFNLFISFTHFFFLPPIQFPSKQKNESYLLLRHCQTFISQGSGREAKGRWIYEKGHQNYLSVTIGTATATIPPTLGTRLVQHLSAWLSWVEMREAGRVKLELGVGNKF